MLLKTQAMRALQEGCSRLGLPNSTAAALLQFLSVKRIHDQFVPEKDRHLSMSPGAKLDKLWHYMLLNTSVSSCVHALLGGVVDHRGTDAWDLADDTKLLQRLYALNLLRLEGHEPDVQLWTEPGTTMHTLRLTNSSFVVLQSVPGGGRLYVTRSLTQDQLALLVGSLETLYTADTQPVQPSARTTQPQPAAAPADSAASGAAGCNVEPATKRPRVEQRLGQDAPRLSLTIGWFLGGRAEVRYSINPDMPFGSVFRHYLQQQNMDPADAQQMKVFFVLRRNRCFVWEYKTPNQIGIKDGEVMDCVLEGSLPDEWLYDADLIGY